MPGTKTNTIKTTVSFAAAHQPYQHDYEPIVMLQQVLNDALTAFAIHPDGTSRYYFLHKGNEADLTQTLGEVADHAHALHLRLRTETISG
ncbi:hypothetical protein E1293_08000 [Actinomadura darangshiensis]|uniref:Uncharacterized protein n=1 Tax=Actinomadura darangshiensis TaxID=705336 RepID=A0A4R5BKK3_9ACTN|nr:hypothetical protein [Actinomadura darangshiensis]TDD87338.1 hypothetical protein E1293_08000 [Actinomadura darangshiensis]